MVLCNQGCGTHVYFKDKRPYNVLDEEKHDCPMLYMAKLWGGRYNTIPMGLIQSAIYACRNTASEVNKNRNIDQILRALELIVDRLQSVTFKMEKQEKQNTEWSNELEGYKKKLVADQRRREEEKRKKSKKGHEWVHGDELN